MERTKGLRPGWLIVACLVAVVQSTCPAITCCREAKGDSCGWQLVFKAVKGNGRSVYDDFLTPGEINEGVPTAMNLTSDMPFRSSIIDRWNTGNFKVEEAKVEFYDDNVRVSWFWFDAVATDKKSWYQQSHLISSSIGGLKTASLVKDSMDGHTAQGRRRFFFEQALEKYGCANDCGFAVVIDSYDETPCSWDGKDEKPFFLYGRSDGCTTWQSEGKVADVMAIHLKVCNGNSAGDE